MGNPLHYSLELPQRCLYLIEELWPRAAQIFQKDQPELGPLTSTFLISMSMPIINLPIERIERHGKVKEEKYADDRNKSKPLTAAIRKTFGEQLNKAPFYYPNAWSFVKVTEAPFFNIANSLPEHLSNQLASNEATRNADKMPTSQ